MISYVLIYDMFPYDICPPFKGMYSDYFFETLKQPADFWKQRSLMPCAQSRLSTWLGPQRQNHQKMHGLFVQCEAPVR